jgi:hypothetical protein
MDTVYLNTQNKKYKAAHIKKDISSPKDLENIVVVS